MSKPLPRVPATEQPLLQSVPDVVYRVPAAPDAGLRVRQPRIDGSHRLHTGEHSADPELARRIVHPDDMPILRDATERPDPSFVYRIRWRHKDGHEFITEQRLQPVYDRDGKLAAIVGVARPVTSARDDRTPRATISPSTSPRRAPSSQGGGRS